MTPTAHPAEPLVEAVHDVDRLARPFIVTPEITVSEPGEAGFWRSRGAIDTAEKCLRPVIGDTEPIEHGPYTVIPSPIDGTHCKSVGLVTW